MLTQTIPCSGLRSQICCSEGNPPRPGGGDENQGWASGANGEPTINEVSRRPAYPPISPAGSPPRTARGDDVLRMLVNTAFPASETIRA